jgi:hypothetical protein
MGTVTNPTGTLGGVSHADAKDCFARMDRTGFGFQDLLLVSTFAADDSTPPLYGGAADRYLHDPPQRVKGEQWVTGTIVARRMDTMDPTQTCPTPPTGVQFDQQVAQQLTVTHPQTGEPVPCEFELNSVAANMSQTCRQDRVDPTSGWIVYTRYDDPLGPEPPDGYRVEGSYDLTRGSERITGTFSAERITATPSSAKPACLSP